VRLYRLAAEQGNARAQSNLGSMYENGRGVSEGAAYKADDIGRLSMCRRCVAGLVRSKMEEGR